MKRFNYILCLLLLFFTACSSEKDSPDVAAAGKVAGTYTGTLTASVMGNATDYSDMALTVTATDNATVTVVTPTFGNPPMQMPAIEIKGVKVAGEGGKYLLAQTEFSQEAGGKKCSGSLRGALDNGSLTVSFSLNYGAMPMPIICTFSAPEAK